MGTFDLSDARTKLKRARKHIVDLDAAIVALESSDLYAITFEHEKRHGTAQLKFQSLHQMDKSINALIGDAVGNLRSVLDYAFCSIAEHCGADPEKVTFPFADEKKGFQGQVRSRNRKLTSDLIRFFDKLEVYKGGAGHSLWAVNKLRNIDKHRLLIASADLAGVIVSYKVGGVTVIDQRVNIEAGQDCVVLSAKNVGEVQITKEPRPAFRVQIKEPSEGIDCDAAVFLRGAIRHVDGLLNDLEQI